MTSSPSPTPPVIEMSGITKAFVGPPDTLALEDVELTVAGGDFVTIQGRSGSGKSTLLNILGLLDTPTRGKYCLNGTDVEHVSDRARTRLRAESIGFVFQAFQLLPDRPAVDNVAMALLYRGGNARAARDKATSALEAVGLAGRAHQLPNRMSGGERQRVAIARAIVGNPDVLLCDEPTGNLDTSNAIGVMELFASLNASGTTIVMITHDPDVAAFGTSRLRLRDGRLAGA